MLVSHTSVDELFAVELVNEGVITLAGISSAGVEASSVLDESADESVSLCEYYCQVCEERFIMDNEDPEESSLWASEGQLWSLLNNLFGSLVNFDCESLSKVESVMMTNMEIRRLLSIKTWIESLHLNQPSPSLLEEVRQTSCSDDNHHLDPIAGRELNNKVDQNHDEINPWLVIFRMLRGGKIEEAIRWSEENNQIRITLLLLTGSYENPGRTQWRKACKRLIESGTISGYELATYAALIGDSSTLVGFFASTGSENWTDYMWARILGRADYLIEATLDQKNDPIDALDRKNTGLSEYFKLSANYDEIGNSFINEKAPLRDLILCLIEDNWESFESVLCDTINSSSEEIKFAHILRLSFYLVVLFGAVHLIPKGSEIIESTVGAYLNHLCDSFLYSLAVSLMVSKAVEQALGPEKRLEFLAMVTKRLIEEESNNEIRQEAIKAIPIDLLEELKNAIEDPLLVQNLA